MRGLEFEETRRLLARSNNPGRHHVKNAFFSASAFLFRNKQTSTKTRRAIKSLMSGAYLREKGLGCGRSTWRTLLLHRFSKQQGGGLASTALVSEEVDKKNDIWHTWSVDWIGTNNKWCQNTKEIKFWFENVDPDQFQQSCYYSRFCLATIVPVVQISSACTHTFKPMNSSSPNCILDSEMHPTHRASPVTSFTPYHNHHIREAFARNLPQPISITLQEFHNHIGETSPIPADKCNPDLLRTIKAFITQANCFAHKLFPQSA